MNVDVDVNVSGRSALEANESLSSSLNRSLNANGIINQNNQKLKKVGLVVATFLLLLCGLLWAEGRS